MANKSAMHDPVRRRNAKSSQLEFFGIPSCSGTFLEDIMAANIGAAFTALTALQRRIQRMINTQLESNAYNVGSITQLLGRLLQVNGNGNLAAFWLEYLQDSAERAVLTSDVFRVSGDLFHEHEAAGCPPVLFYEHEVIMDGRDLPVKSNYLLLRVIPGEGLVVDETRRPLVIVCPRAGHGVGAGGHSADSQVGSALRGGHPVYLISFRNLPEEGQNLSNVADTEVVFVREVAHRHPNAAKPVLIGNCQGGWATLNLVATYPDLDGPIVVNGAPVSFTAGKLGEHSFRYNAGLLGGAWTVMFLSDLGGGLFDGAHLTLNFLMFKPDHQLFRYLDLFRDVDTAQETFLRAETWWSSFCLLAENEIRWIIEQLFVGSRLVKGQAPLGPGRPAIDLKEIRAPIVIFCSHGDQITPPAQALTWILDTYKDEEELRILGKRIIYLIHNQVGHLGIFISSDVISKEYQEVVTTLDVIELLAPGIYELRIENVREVGTNEIYSVEIAERSFDDIRTVCDNFKCESAFTAVSRVSEFQAQLYQMLVRPFVKMAVTNFTAELGRSMHPLRLSRTLMSSNNPFTASVEYAAKQVRACRHKPSEDNPFLAVEAAWALGVRQALEFWRECRDMSSEMLFLTLWNTPWVRYIEHSRNTNEGSTLVDDLQQLSGSSIALSDSIAGGFVEAVIRMLVLLVRDRHSVRRDRLRRWLGVLKNEPFKSLDAERLQTIVRQQTAIASDEVEQAIQTLPLLLLESEKRRLAYRLVCYIVGPAKEMLPRTDALLQQFAEVLGQPRAEDDVAEDPLSTLS